MTVPNPQGVPWLTSKDSQKHCQQRHPKTLCSPRRGGKSLDQLASAYTLDCRQMAPAFSTEEG